MVLELATTCGALTGAYLAGHLSGRWLYLIFGLLMGYSAFRAGTLAPLTRDHPLT